MVGSRLPDRLMDHPAPRYNAEFAVITCGRQESAKYQAGIVTPIQNSV